MSRSSGKAADLGGHQSASAPRAWRLLAIALAASSCSCASRFLVKGVPEKPSPLAVVPGCPSTADGKLTRCQMGRAGWAWIVWKRGWVTRFVTSGGAVHTPYVEAEALAMAMTSLGVPADRIYLEPHALHTDENMHNALRIGRALGVTEMSVVSSRGQAAWSCAMLSDWGMPCQAFALDHSALEAELAPHLPALERLQVPRDESFVPIEEKERRIAEQTGYRRPPSAVLYPMMALRRLFGGAYTPHGPAEPTLITWAQRSYDSGAIPSQQMD